MRGLLAGALAFLVLAAPANAALAPGQIVVVDGRAFGNCVPGCGGLITVDPATGAESELSANTMPINASSQLFSAPFALAFDAAGNIISISTFGMGGSCNHGCGGVLKVDPTTGKETLVSSNAMPINSSSQYFSEPTGVTVDGAGNIWVADWGHCVGCGKVIKVDPNTGQETLISSNAMPVNASSQLFDYAQGLALDHNGDILVANASTSSSRSPSIIEVDPVTGKETGLSDNNMPINAASQYLHAPVNLAIDAAGNILVADWGDCSSGHCGDVVKIDPATGKQALLSANSLPVNASSQYLDGPTGIALDQQGNIIVADESAFGGCLPGCGGVIKVDPLTGKETKVSANDMPVNSSNQLFAQPFDVVVVGAGGEPPSGGGGGAGGGAGGGSGGGGSTGGGGGGGSQPGGSPGSPGGGANAKLVTKIVKARIRGRVRAATFRFKSVGTKRQVRFYCRLDRRPALPCLSPVTYRHLHPGQHTFAVHAVALGNPRLRSPAAVRRFRIRG